MKYFPTNMEQHPLYKKYESAINKATHDKRSPADLANYYEKEEQRIKKLSSDEQNQILNDYYFAINLAMQEIDDKTTESFNIETNTSRFNFPISC